LWSDNAADITGLPGIGPGTPIQLGAAVNGGYAVSTALKRPPFAVTPANTATNGVRVAANTPLLGGFIKIEKQTAPDVWSDVTLEILNLGFDSPGYLTSTPGSALCADPTPDAVLRLQRPVLNGAACYNAVDNSLFQNAAAPTRYYPNALYDPREAELRDTAPASMQFGGVMYYVGLDARNLSRWFQGVIGTTGNQSLNVNGFTVYFSDRRGNRDGANAETAEYGNEDIVNPLSATGAQNNGLDVGEDFNANTTLEIYGSNARAPFPNGAAANWAGVVAPLASTAKPWTGLGASADQVEIARRNPAIFFRRALKLTNGALGNLVAPGLTISSENPVYIEGNWNANDAGFGNPHVATAVLADAVTLLSKNWNDWNSFVNAGVLANRGAADTWYRIAVIAGKGRSFLQPTGTGQDFGTDGGAHNFLRYIEDWSGDDLKYRGSIASLYFSRQATGTYKCCATVYSPPTRGYNFDVEFLTPALLPPRTPMFRDVNITGFAQVIRPN
ncbi:MAG: hypothetical protein ABI652_08155, partial [Acidobacteriota bacterium]